MTPTPDTKKKRKGFFALDMDRFEQAGRLGLEPVAAYLALMAGTNESNVSCSWGIQAIQGATGLTRHEAKRAVAALARRNLVVELDTVATRARTKPRYQLPRTENRPALAAKEQAAVDAVRRSEEPDAQAAFRAAKKGWLKKVDGGWTEAPPDTKVAFVPNSFVRTGTGSSPLARLLNAGEVNALLLAMRLYQRQNLMEARGVPVEDVRQHYRADVSDPLTRHPYRFITLAPGRIWGAEEVSFTGSAQSYKFNLENSNFWPALRVLELSHVVEWAVYTANGKPPDKYAPGRPARPVAVVRNGIIQVNAPESQAGRCAYATLRAQVFGVDYSEMLQDWPEAKALVAIEHASVPHIEGVGILRMTHLADTENMRVWWRQIHAETRETVFFYNRVAEEMGLQAPDLMKVPASGPTAA